MIQAPLPMGELASIVRLRWAAILVVALALAVAVLVLGVDVPVVALGSVLAVSAASNALLVVRPMRGAVGPVFVLDVVLLTVGLGLAGGPSNPFSVVYLVYVTLTAVVAPGLWAWLTVALSALGYGSLFFLPASDPHAHHHAMHGDEAFSLHLQGMWIAFTLAAALIAVFVSRVSRALAAEREAAARSARLLGLTTLAAGAAHELATPLSTIKTVASELERALVDRPDLAAFADDVRLVRAEVDRSRVVLERLSLRAGELRGESVAPTKLGELARALADLPEALRVRVDVHCATPDASARVPRRAIEQVIENLTRNALDASGSEGRVELRTAVDRDALVIEVADRGTGMDEDTLAIRESPDADAHGYAAMATSRYGRSRRFRRVSG